MSSLLQAVEPCGGGLAVLAVGGMQQAVGGSCLVAAIDAEGPVPHRHVNPLGIPQAFWPQL